MNHYYYDILKELGYIGLKNSRDLANKLEEDISDERIKSTFFNGSKDEDLIQDCISVLYSCVSACYSYLAGNFESCLDMLKSIKDCSNTLSEKLKSCEGKKSVAVDAVCTYTIDTITSDVTRIMKNRI